MLHESSSATPQRCAYGDFPLTRGREAEQHVRHVGTGDQQQETDRTEKDEQQRADSANDALVQLGDSHAEAVVPRKFLPERRVNRRHVRLRRFECDARLEACDDLKHRVRPVTS